MRNPVNSYEAIFFDVGGTILNIVRHPFESIAASVAHLGGPTQSDYSRAIGEVYQEWLAEDGRPEIHDLPETWVEHNRRALAALGFRGDIESAGRLMETAFLSEGWEPYSDAVETLAALTDRGFALAVVSNWPPTLEATLEATGLRSHFSVVVASGMVGYAKPHRRIFQLAAEQVGVDPRRVLYVGDSVEHDVAGAQAAGMDVVLVARDGQTTDHEPTVRSLSAIPDLLT